MRFTRATLSPALLLLAAVHPALAAAITWTGAVSDQWGGSNGTATNWSGDALPNGAAQLLFDGSPAYTTTNNDIDNLSLTSIVFSVSANAGFTLTGKGVTLTGSGAITDNASLPQTLSLASIALAGTQIFSVGVSKSLIINSPLSGSGTLTLLGGGSLTLAGANTYTGNLVVQGGTGVTLMDGASWRSAAATLTIGNHTATNSSDNSSWTMVAGGRGTITAATLIIDYHTTNLSAGTAASTLAINGDDTLNVDTLKIDAGATGTGSTITGRGGNGALVLGNKATLTLHGSSESGSMTLLDIANGSYGNSSNNASITGKADFSAGTVNGTIGTIAIATGKVGAGSSTAATGSMSFANGTLNATAITLATVGASSSSQAANGTLTLTAGGTGTLTVGSGGLTFGNKGTGVVNINGATLAVQADITSSAASATLNLNGGTLDMGGHSIGTTTNAISVNLTQGTLANLGGTGINGAGLTIPAGSAITLSGTNSYSGATQVGGTLLLNGSISASPVALAPGSTLAGTGTLGSTLAFAPGSTLRIDPSAGAFAFSTLADNLSGAGNVTLALTGTLHYDTPIVLFHNTATPNFTFAAIQGYDQADYTPVITYADHDYVLSFVSTAAAVPEPASLGLLGLGGLLLLRRRRC